MVEPAVLATVTRSGIEESIHVGHVAVCDATGRLTAEIGDPDHLVFARSSMKPVQAAVSLRESGEEIPDDELAVMCGSHNGEPVHVAAVARLLSRSGLDVSALRCPPAWPRFPEDARSVAGPGPEYHNCSGKHAGMLLASARRGFPPEDYLQPEHPLQRAVLESVVTLSGLNEVVVGVDGCGVPVHAMPLRAMATIFARFASARNAGPIAGQVPRVTRAMRAAPHLVAGRDRVDTAVMETVESVIVKGGAEGLMCAAILDRGVGIAVKVADGSARAAGPGVIRALELLEVVTPAQKESLARFARPDVRGGSAVVGTLSSGFHFRRP